MSALLIQRNNNSGNVSEYPDEFFSFLDDNHEITQDNQQKRNQIKNMFHLFNNNEDEEEDDDQCEEDEDDQCERETLIEETTTTTTNNRNKKSEICINCGCRDTLYNDNEMIVCTECGCENNFIIDSNPEWRFYGNDDNKRSSDPNRCGLPTNPFIDKPSLSAVMLGKGYEKYRKINSWNGISYKERQLMTILNMVMNKANIENVPKSIIDKTILDYQTICTAHVKRGTSRESLIAACFSQAMREHGYVRSHLEIAKLFNIKAKKLSKGYNDLTKLMYKKDKDYAKKIKPVD